MGGAAVDLFLRVVKKHIIGRKGLFDPSKTVGQRNGGPLGRGFDDQNIHVINVIAKLTRDGLPGSGPKEGFEHILSEGTAGDEPMLAMSR